MTTVTKQAGPQTGTGTLSGNVNGQAIAITVFSTVKAWGPAWLRLVFLEPKVLPQTLGTLQKLSFIHFARWTLIKKLAYNGAPQPEKPLRYPHLYFESNFNGGWEEYIDAFSHVLKQGMATFWGSSYGFPQAVPTAPFKSYIKNSELVASHFYSAYPESTTTMVNAAIALDEQMADLKKRAEELTPDEFVKQFQNLLVEAQRCF